MKKNVIIFGIVNSVATLVYSLIPIYNKSLSPILVNLIPLIVITVLSILAAYIYKKECPQSSSFRKLFLVILYGQAIGQIVGTILIIAFFNFVPEETKLTLINEYLENHYDFYSRISGSNATAFQDALEKAADNLFSIKNLLVNVPFVLILNVIISVIVALFMKKEYE